MTYTVENITGQPIKFAIKKPAVVNKNNGRIIEKEIPDIIEAHESREFKTKEEVRQFENIPNVIITKK